MKMPHPGETAALITAISWTVSTILFEQTTRRAGTFVVNLVKVTFALVFLSVLLWIVKGQAFPPTVSSRALPWLVLSGLIGFVVGDLFLFQAFVTVGARISMLVYTLSPAMTAVGSAVLLGEHLGRLGMAGIITTLAGVMLVVLRRRGEETTPWPRGLLGAFLALVGAICQASGYLLSKKAMLFCDPLEATYVRLAIAVPGFAVALLAAREGPRLVNSLRDRFVAPRVAMASFFGPFIGVGLSMFALKNGNAGVVTTIMAMPPVFLIVPAVLVLKEKVTLRDVIGATLAVCGVALFFL